MIAGYTSIDESAADPAFATAGGERRQELFPQASGVGAGPNIALEPTRNSLRSCLAPAIARGSPPAFGSF